MSVETNGQNKILVPILTFLLGCTLTAGGYAITFGKDITANEQRIISLEKTDAQIQNQLNNYVNLTSQLIETNRNLIAELRAQKGK